MPRIVAFSERPRDFQTVDPAKRAVEPAAGRLRVGMRTDQQRGPGMTRAAEHIADAVDLRLEPGVAHAAGEPVARVDIDWGQRKPHDAGAGRAEAAKCAQVA